MILISSGAQMPWGGLSALAQQAERTAKGHPFIKGRLKLVLSYPSRDETEGRIGTLDGVRTETKGKSGQQPRNGGDPMRGVKDSAGNV